MAVAGDFPSRSASVGVMPSSCLEDRFEVIKEIGDGSFGSVTVARVRTAGAHVAKRGTMVCMDRDHREGKKGWWMEDTFSKHAFVRISN